MCLEPDLETGANQHIVLHKRGYAGYGLVHNSLEPSLLRLGDNKQGAEVWRVNIASGVSSSQCC